MGNEGNFAAKNLMKGFRPEEQLNQETKKEKPPGAHCLKPISKLNALVENALRSQLNRACSDPQYALYKPDSRDNDGGDLPMRSSGFGWLVTVERTSCVDGRYEI